MTTGRKTTLTVLALGLVLLSRSWCQAQEAQNEPQVAPIRDPIARLNLTPEQREKIRAIRVENKEERTAISQRLKAANEALEQALDAENPNEAEIEQRLQDLSAAQAASTRMRVLTELQIRRILTREQIVMWREFRLEAARQRRNNAQSQGAPIQNGNRLRPNQRNGLAPSLDQRPAPTGSPRP